MRAKAPGINLKVSLVSLHAGGPAQTSAAAEGSPVVGQCSKPCRASLPLNPLSSAQGEHLRKLQVDFSDSQSSPLINPRRPSAPVSAVSLLAARLCRVELWAGRQRSWHSHTEGHRGTAVPLKT